MPKSQTVLGSIPASSDTVESEGRQIKKSKISSLFKTKRLFWLLLRYVASSRNYEISCIVWIKKKPESFHTKKEICFSGTVHEPPLPYTLANFSAPLFLCTTMHLKPWVCGKAGEYSNRLTESSLLFLFY